MTSEAGHSSPQPSIAHRRFVQLLVLAAGAWAASYARYIFGPLQEAIKVSLALHDHHIALMQGMAMALPIALGSVPLGLMSDRASRVRMLRFFLAVAFVSLIMSALIADFHWLMFSRFLAGFATPGIIVPVYSMASDMFKASERGRATMVLAIGEVAAAPAAFALGGALLVGVGALSSWEPLGLVLQPWQWSMLFMSGLLLPILFGTFLLKEPERKEIEVSKPPLRWVWQSLWRYRSVAVPLQIGRAALFIADGAVLVWGAPLFSRTYHLPADDVGALMGLVLLVGVSGMLIGGPLADYCSPRGGPRQTLLVMAGLSFLSVPAALFAFMPDANLAAAMLTVFLVFGYIIASAALALTLTVIPGELRGLNLGISIVVGSLFFVGLAPLAVSALSEVLGGANQIGHALTIVCIGMSLLNVAIFGLSAKFFPSNASPLPRSNRFAASCRTHTETEQATQAPG